MTKDLKSNELNKEKAAKKSIQEPAKKTLPNKKNTTKMPHEKFTEEDSLVEFTEEELAQAAELAKKVNGPNPKSAGYFFRPNPFKRLLEQESNYPDSHPQPK